jgi:tetratricopeptide (TPR) repeat protein
MAKKRKRKTESQGRTAKGKKSAKKRRAPETPPDSPGGAPMLDRRAMEGMMRQFIPEFEDGERSPLDEAQDIIYEALEADGDERLVLAQEALAVSPDCAEAYVLMAESSPDRRAALNLYEQGLAAAERVLGEEAFRKYEGHFWGFLETRPYMRAREGMAQCLWAVGRKEEAIGHFREMLRLNPGDNQGIRYLLAHALLDLDLDDELKTLFEQFDDDARADWTYTKALLAFRREGDSHVANALLKRAAKSNEHVPAYLTGSRELPHEPPPHITLGGEDEAIMYTGQFLPAWRNTPGALTWLRSALKVPLTATAKPQKPDWRRQKATLSRLDQDPEEVWQVDAHAYDFSLSAEGEEVQPWMVCVADATGGAILALDIGDQRPSKGDVWQAVIDAMRHPRHGDPRRPGTIEVRQKSFASAWTKKLNQIGVDCRQCDELEWIDRFIEETTTSDEVGRLLSGAEDLSELEQRDATDLPLREDVVWQVDARRMATWLEEDGEPVRPRIAAVANCAEGTVIAHELSADATTEELLWEVVLRALWSPLSGDPHRPGEIQVLAPDHRDFLAARLGSAGVECTTIERLELLDEMLGELDRVIEGQDRTMTAMVEAPGVTEEQVGDFFAAADSFYRSAPWRRVPPDAVVRVESQGLSDDSWYVIVMGQSGMTVGLALYEDLDLLRDLLSGGGDDEGDGRKTSGLSVFFDDEVHLAARDLDAAERHGWPIAAPEAYPTALRINPGMSVRPPLAWELRLIEACLRAVPQLVDAEAEKVIVRLPVDSKETEMRLAWIDPFEELPNE